MAVTDVEVAAPGGSHVAVTLSVPEPAGWVAKVQATGRVVELSSATVTSEPPVTVHTAPPPRSVDAVTSATTSPAAYWLGLVIATSPCSRHPDSVLAPARAVTV